MRLIGNAIAAIKDAPVSGPGIRDYLRHVRNYEGASGAITFDEHGDVVKPFAIKTIEAGSPKTLFVK